MDRLPLLTFSHLRWNSASRRPQNIMSRMAGKRDILFIEEPILRGGDPDLEVIAVEPRVRVIQPHLPFNGTGFGAHQTAALETLLRAFLAREGWKEHAAWVYTPMAVTVARALRPKALVYDCMNELSSFLLAPPELPEREAELLAYTDVVFADGPALHRAKRYQHPFVHNFPSGVDTEHFASADDLDEARDQESLPHPRLGLFGVVDERMDLSILQHLAAERPDWQIVVVGPIARIEASRLPHGANLHYIGLRSYQEIPSYLAGWDVCLMPFQKSAVTTYITPTKCLEYMAGGRPIVSTPIPDISEPYGDVVRTGEGPEGFLEACERALAETERERATRVSLTRRILQKTSWEETVDRMDLILRHIAGEGFARRVLPSREMPREREAELLTSRSRGR